MRWKRRLRSRSTPGDSAWAKREARTRRSKPTKRRV